MCNCMIECASSTSASASSTPVSNGNEGSTRLNNTIGQIAAPR